MADDEKLRWINVWEVRKDEAMENLNRDYIRNGLHAAAIEMLQRGALIEVLDSVMERLDAVIDKLDAVP